MKKSLFWMLCSAFAVLSANGQTIPRSADLKETGELQRRDLSMPMSRLVLNFFDFKSPKTLYEYSTRESMPLNIAYLSTEKNTPGKQAITRFSRTVTDLLTMHKSARGLDALMADPATGTARDFTTAWMPHCLPFEARYEDGAVEGVDFIYDPQTVVRQLDFEGNTENYLFSGTANGEVEFRDNLILVENNNLRYAIGFSVSVRDFTIRSGKWYLALAGERLSNKGLTISVAFADKSESQSTLIERALAPIKRGDIAKVLRKNEKYWDDFLARVPHPHNFELTSVNTFGVTAEQIRLAYYKAWVFTAQNVLCEDPERYPYPQICTGKSSLWDEGEIRAPFSAAWESFLGIQMYAYIDPDLSWKAFKGLMSLVDEEGMLGGESLPSRKAQTALILYELTGDKESLREVCPALQRYLDWRLKITHWVYGNIQPSTDYKDAEFVFSALCDIQYLLKIFDILEMPAAAQVWQAKFDELSKNGLKWFWETPQTLPIQNYWIKSNRREDRNTIWITTCLHVKDYIKGDYLTSTMKKFDLEYDPDLSFGNFDMPKYPDMSYSVYGLIEHGFTQRAVGVMEASLRDIVRAHTRFAEQYTKEDLRPDGVYPSLFGSSMIIDFVLMLNGYLFGDGAPKGLLLPGRTGGVSDLKIQGKSYEIRTDGPNHTVLFGPRGKLHTIEAAGPIVELPR